ncbi:hypothetical protein ACQCVP_21565 [Rossellomorea vietnamensis]|uniref:hypothetical protein n=1 Tax=Rossellomorea vietnamensis TaxID=218284 RepID=UPI003CEBC8D0
MKINKKLILIILTGITLLAACTNDYTFEDFFHKKMEENTQEYDEEVQYSYSLIHQEENVVHSNDALAVFTENNLQGEQIFIAYFEREGGHWNWKQTRGAEWDTPVKWSAMHEEPYIYSGAISDNSIKEVYAGQMQAKIIQIEEDKRFWYVISREKDVEVKMVMADGTEKIVEEIDEEMLKEWQDKKTE